MRGWRTTGVNRELAVVFIPLIALRGRVREKVAQANPVLWRSGRSGRIGGGRSAHDAVTAAALGHVERGVSSMAKPLQVGAGLGKFHHAGAQRDLNVGGFIHGEGLGAKLTSQALQAGGGLL